MTQQGKGVAIALSGIFLSICASMSFVLGTWSIIFIFAPLFCLWAAIFVIRDESWSSAKSAYACIALLIGSMLMTGSYFVELHGGAFGL